VAKGVVPVEDAAPLAQVSIAYSCQFARRCLHIVAGLAGQP
jgi:hypothetical protein